MTLGPYGADRHLCPYISTFAGPLVSVPEAAAGKAEPALTMNFYWPVASAAHSLKI